MRTDELLRIARATIAKVPACMAISVDGNGDADARTVNAASVALAGRRAAGPLQGNTDQVEPH